MRIITLNANGIRSATNKGLADWLAAEPDWDILCLQEMKALETDVPAAMRAPGGRSGHFNPAQRKGYAGTAIWSRLPALHTARAFGVPEFDDEGRYLELDLGPLLVISLYLPSGSSGPERQASKDRFLQVFPDHLRALRARGKELLLCGDLNIAHREIDLKNWRSNQKNSGFLPHERAWMSHVLDELGFVDVYRHLHPDTTGESYTWWSNRGQAYANNVGWRLDYQLATPALAATARSARIYKEQKFSDHAPLCIDYDFVI